MLKMWRSTTQHFRRHRVSNESAQILQSSSSKSPEIVDAHASMQTRVTCGCKYVMIEVCNIPRANGKPPWIQFAEPHWCQDHDCLRLQPPAKDGLARPCFLEEFVTANTYCSLTTYLTGLSHIPSDVAISCATQSLVAPSTPS